MSNQSSLAIDQSVPEYFTGIKLVLFTLAVSLTTFMEVLDSTIVNVAIPTISGNLGSTISQGAWVISSYALASAVVVPLTGWLAARFGQIKIFILSIIFFVISSILCGIAASMEQLVVFRFLQGFVSGPMVPLSQSLLLINYPPAKRPLAMAFFVITIIVAPIAGPILGGYITYNSSWPWIFYINAPVGLIAASILYILLKHKKDKKMKLPIDYIGLILLIVGVGSLQIMLDNGNEYDWFNSSFIIIAACVACIGIIAFIIWELTDKYPVVDLLLLKNRNFLVASLTMILGMFCFFGSVVIFPLWLQTLKGYTSQLSGLATAPIGIIPLFLSPIIGMFLPRLNIRMVITVGFAIFAITMFWFASFNLDTPYSDLFLPRLLQGIGIACFFLPINQIALSNIKMENLSMATGLFNFFRAISTSIATAVVIFSWQRLSKINYAHVVEKVNPSSNGTADYLRSLSKLGLHGKSSYQYISSVASQQASSISVSYIFSSMGVIFLLLIIVVWFAKPPFSSKH